MTDPTDTQATRPTRVKPAGVIAGAAAGLAVIAGVALALPHGGVPAVRATPTTAAPSPIVTSPDATPTVTAAAPTPSAAPTSVTTPRPTAVAPGPTPTASTANTPTPTRTRTTATATPRPTATPPAYPDVTARPGAKLCAPSGSGPYSGVATGNASTSCAFALNVRAAYVGAGVNGATRTVQASSPVTGKTYTVVCSGDQPAVCTGGNNGYVLLFGGRYVG